METIASFNDEVVSWFGAWSGASRVGRKGATDGWAVPPQWRITEEKSEVQIAIDHIPVDGPFVVDLPAASYRLTVVTLNSSLGVWQTSLP